MHSVAKPVNHPVVGIELVRDWVPGDELKAVLVLVHGLAEHSGRYERTGSLLAQAGFRVRAFDLIGAGGSGGRRWDVDDWNRYHDQIQSHMEWAIGQEKPVVLMGHSLGALLALGYALSGRPGPKLLVLSVPALGGGARWLRALARVGARVAPGVALSNVLPGENLSRDPAVGEAYRSDPLVHPRTTFRTGAALFAEMTKVTKEVGKLAIPTLVLHGGADRIVPTASSAFLAEQPAVERRVYPQLRHEILNEPEGPEIVAEIIEWISDRLSAVSSKSS